jgi:UDP-2,4-diacetamido-2,4,6-trideoxy-beta-L-altropyranose hydrolase
MSVAAPIVIRTEGGPGIGFGHVRRCLSLAQALRANGAAVIFLANEDAVVRQAVQALAFDLKPIRVDRDPGETAAWLDELHAMAIIVDAYRFQGPWFERLAPRKHVVVMIDDLGDRQVPEDVLVVNCTPEAPASPARTSNANDFLGPRYALLRPEFAQPVRRHPRKPVEQVLVTVGGGDPHGLTPRLTALARRALPSSRIEAVIGPLFDEVLFGRLNGLRAGVTYHRRPQDMRGLMLAADLAVSAGGQTLYELAATGTPTIAVRVADNQTRNLEGFERAGALVWAGDAADPYLEPRVANALQELAGDAARRTQLGVNGRWMVDGRGAERVAAVILSRLGAEVLA